MVLATIKNIVIWIGGILLLTLAIPLVFSALKLDPLMIPQPVYDSLLSLKKVYATIYYFCPIDYLLTCLLLILAVKNWKLLFHVLDRIIHFISRLFTKGN